MGYGIEGERNILKDLVIKNKVWIGASSAIYIVLIFILSGSLNLIKLGSSDFKIMTEDDITRVMTKTEIITEGLTIGNFQILIFFASIAIFCAIFFKDKEKNLIACLNNKKARINYFKEGLILLFIPLFLAIVVNLLFKSLLFVMNREILSLKMEVSYIFVIMTYFYMIFLSALGISVNFLFQIGVKSRFSAAILPMFMFEGLILVAGVSNIFTSKEIPIIFTTSNLISDLIFNYVNMFTKNYRIELLGTNTYFITILGILAVTMVFLACTCRYIMTYDEKNLRYSLRFTVIRRFIILSLVSVLTMYISIVIFGSIAMFKEYSLTVEQAFIFTNVISITLIPTLTITIELLYMKNNDIPRVKISKNNFVNEGKKQISKSSKKFKKVKFTKTNKKLSNSLNGKQENLSIVPIDENLQNKGIFKETILAKHKKKNIQNEENKTFIDSKTIERKEESLVSDYNLNEENDFFSIDD